MVVGALAGPCAFARRARAGRDIPLHADDGLEAGFSGLFLKLPRGVQISVVRNGERGLFEFLRAFNQVVDAVRPVEERVFRMTVQVYERHGREQ